MVDVNRRLLGTIGVDDVIDVIREEATEDIQRLGGVGGDETVLDPPRARLRQAQPLAVDQPRHRGGRGLGDRAL